MRFFHKYQNHTTFENKQIPSRKPEVTLCSIEGNKRNGMHYNYLPYDAEIEYLESTGTQYIDTGINADSNMGFSMIYSFTDLSNDNYSRVGAIRQSGSNYIRHHTTRTGTGSNIQYMLPILVKELANATNKHTLVLDTVNSSIGYDGNFTTYNEAAFDCNLNYYLFARNNYLDNTASITCAKIKIYQVKIYSNGVLVRDFIPVRVGSTGYMYDKVSKRLFGNSGTGNFTLGQDIIPIEYIRSTAKTQYINTGVKACMNKIRCICDMAPMNTTDSAFFGSRGTYYLFYCVGSNYFWPISKCNTINGTLQTNKKYHIDWNKGNFTLTGENGVYQQGSRSNTTQDGNPMYIFNFNPIDGNGRYGNAKLYYFKIYVDNVLVRDFSPVRVGTVGYLFDKVNRQLYGNAGSGAFTLGPDIT